MRVANWLTHLELDWKSVLWSHWFRECSRDHTLIRYDMRGVGLSDREVPEQSIPAWVEDLHSVVKSLDLEEFTLMGLCQGGAVATAYAAKYPERVKKLVLYDTYCAGALASGQPEKQREEALALGRIIEVGWGHEASAFRKIFVDLLMPGAPEEKLEWLAELQRQTVSPGMASRLWKAFHELDVRNDARRIDVPTTIFHVKGDRLVPFEEGRRLAGLINEARFVPLEGKNHILLEEDEAWKVFLKQMRDFIGAAQAPVSRAGQLFPELTCREREVLELVAQGLKNSQIAKALFISPKTVRNHVYRIFNKLQVDSRALAIIKAREAGMGRGRLFRSS